MAERLVKREITDKDIDATGKALHGHGPDSEGWQKGRERAKRLANDTTLQQLIFEQFQQMQATPSDPEAIMLRVSAVVEYAFAYEHGTNASDAAAAISAARNALFPPIDAPV